MLTRGMLLKPKKNERLRRSFFLSFLHSLPTDKSVKVVYEEHRKADCYREVGYILERCKYPKNNKDHIVCGIGKCVVRTSSPREVDCKKACRYRDRAWDQISVIQREQNKIKGYCNDCGENYREYSFFD